MSYQRYKKKVRKAQRRSERFREAQNIRELIMSLRDTFIKVHRVSE